MTHKIIILIFNVGFLVFGTHVHAQANVAPKSLSLVTYNIRTAANGFDRVIKALKTMDPDFLCIQEIHGKSFVGDFRDQAEGISKILGMNYFFSKNRLWISGEYGVAIFSKFPLENKTQIQLPNLPGEEPEILLCGHAVTPKGKVLLCTAHLISRPRNKNNDADQLRLEQASTIVDFLLKQETPILFGGDLNAYGSSPVKDLFRKHFSDFMLQSGKGRKATFPAKFPIVMIDYLFYRGPFIPWETRVIKTRASDHRPLRTEFQWKNVTPAMEPVQKLP